MFWAQVFLGIIAVATLVMAVVQVGAIIYGVMLARRVAGLVDQIERELKPIIESLNAIAHDAAKATALAAVQVERVDKLFADLASRVEQTAASVQRAVVGPLRDGAAMMAGLRAAMAVFRDLTRRPGAAGARNEEDDALFIG